MKKFLKWTGIVVVGLISVLVVAVGSLHLFGKHRLTRHSEVTVQMVDVPTDSASIERGKHLVYAVTSCAACHNTKFQGDIFMEGAPFGVIAANNLTPGNGGIGAVYTNEDWVRAIRHGVGGDGRPLTMMPTHQYTHMSDQDLGAIIAFLNTLPAVDNQPPKTRIAFPGTIILGVLAYRHLPVSVIDHTAPRRVTAPTNILEKGEYLSRIGACHECHGEKMAGLTNENGPPPGPNLTPAGNLKDWSKSDFIQAIRTGQTPDNRILNPKDMPWPGFALMTDDELTAIFQYLQTLPEKALGENS